MFNLVGKRYIFLIISLIVIIPGTLSLLIKGMNVGIDFAGGATVQMRPSSSVTTAEVTNLLRPLNLVNLQVLPGNDANLPANGVVWVQLNTQVGSDSVAEITNRLQNAYGNSLVVQFSDLTVDNKKVTVVTITKLPTTTPTTSQNACLVSNSPSLPSPPITSQVECLLLKLSNTTGPTSLTVGVTPTVSSSPTVGATATDGKSTPTASATATPKATATATPKATATGTPKATTTPTASGTATPVVTPTATSTPTNPAATIPVKFEIVQSGSVTDTLTILTSSEVHSDKVDAIRSALLQGDAIYTYVSTNASVSASVASETTLRAVLAVIAASVCILLYVWFSFRKVAKPWRYGACAIIALLHDVLVVLGVFSILGWLLNIQIDTLFITALLTVVGFSVHDTIVVFDRIRENMQRRTSESFDQIVNASLVQTLARSLNTSLTVIFTLSALTLFGGTTTRTFTLALLVGIISGTYSSIFNASMLLVMWEKGELSLKRLRRSRAPDSRDTRELVRTRG